MRRWAIAICAFAVLSGAAIAKKNPVVGGAEMLPDQDVVDNLEKSADYTEFVKRIKAAHLVDTLKGTGPYTVFAPVAITAQGGKLLLQSARVLKADIKQKNGTLHVVDALAIHQP